MFESLTAYHDASLMALRLSIGVIFIYHGYIKWKMPSMKGGMQIVMKILKVANPIIGLCLLFALQIQLMSLLVAIIMLGAIVCKISLWKIPFSSMKATGWEYDLLILVSALVLLTSSFS